MSVCDLVDSDVRVVATVHDSIVADVPNKDIDRTAKLMHDIMVEQPVKQLGWEPDDIPFAVDISVGENWGTLSDYELKVAA